MSRKEIPKIYLSARKNLQCNRLLYNSKCKLNMSECPLCNYKQNRQCDLGVIYTEVVCSEKILINFKGILTKVKCDYVERFDGINVYGSVSYGDYEMLLDSVNHNGDIILSYGKNIVVPHEQNAILLDKIRRAKINRIVPIYEDEKEDGTEDEIKAKTKFFKK